MRHLVACDSCKRQFDASGRRSGSRFRCHCGRVVTVPEPKSHDATVVRCSACGAPRQGKAERCSYCESDFTLHERDLHTICPKCMARVSDRARFCHHCAVPILPQGGAGDTTTLVCPACGKAQRLVSRALPEEEMAVFECGSCTGLWLSHEVLDFLVKRAAETAPPPEAHSGPHRRVRAAAPAEAQQGPLYRPCPGCGKLMVRQNYGKRSGVIVDVCGDHGVWFDADELSRILQWVRDAGLERSRQRDEEQRREDERQRRTKTQAVVAGVEKRPRDFDFFGGLFSIFIDI